MKNEWVIEATGKAIKLRFIPFRIGLEVVYLLGGNYAVC